MIQSHHIHGGRDLHIHFEPRFRDDAIPSHSQGPRPLDTFWTEVQGWCNPPLSRGRDLRIHFELRFRDDAIHPFHRGRDLRIHFEPKFKDDAIPPHSWGPRPSDTFWTEVQGWCNPTTFMKTEVTRSILDRCPRMIQSLFILEDQGHRITFGQMSRDDTIPLQHHYSPFQGRSFRATPSLSRKCSNFTWDRGFVSTSLSKPSSSTSLVCEYWKNHHLYI